MRKILWNSSLLCVFQVLSPEEQALAAKNDYNFDHPGAFDFELLVSTLRKLKQGKSVKIPVYDFTTHRRHKDWVSLVLLLERNLSVDYAKDEMDQKEPQCWGSIQSWKCIKLKWNLNF